jgi:hypothetical protein
MDEKFAAWEVTIATAGRSGFRKLSRAFFAKAAIPRMTDASSFSVPSVLKAPTVASLMLFMKEFVYHSHSITPEPCTKERAALRSTSAPVLSVLRRAVLLKLNSGWGPVS